MVTGTLCGCTPGGLPSPYTIHLSFPVITQNQINTGHDYSDKKRLRTRDGLCPAAESDTHYQYGRLVLQECRQDASQYFTFHRNRIIHQGLCLDAAGQDTREDTPVIIWPCTENANQRWLTEENKIRGQQSRKCLGTESLIARKGDPVVLADCDFSRALEFTGN
ncbi:TPA: ricin-type beta-trefoil lectin domain protein [Klebsiella oxytoca]|uniref:Ricin-type beta-trefoil lectin domain protein n=1 Tax=Klebsiella oxytoca TaxID=571 RepID=A0AAN5LE84_KLEOX|nr:ricin-type beta-trefoil lectin domain protein [Klebsiella oxytoca]